MPRLYVLAWSPDNAVEIVTKREGGELMRIWRKRKEDAGVKVKRMGEGFVSSDGEAIVLREFDRLTHKRIWPRLPKLRSELPKEGKASPKKASP